MFFSTVLDWRPAPFVQNLEMKLMEISFDSHDKMHMRWQNDDCKPEKLSETGLGESYQHGLSHHFVCLQGS